MERSANARNLVRYRCSRYLSPSILWNRYSHLRPVIADRFSNFCSIFPVQLIIQLFFYNCKKQIRERQEKHLSRFIYMPDRYFFTLLDSLCNKYTGVKRISFETTVDPDIDIRRKNNYLRIVFA